MKKKIIAAAAICLIIPAVSFVSYFIIAAKTAHHPIAVQGVIDLTGKNLIHSTPIALDGSWEFYWKKLLSPEDLSVYKVPDSYTDVPALWGKESSMDTAPEGFATYRLTVKHDPSLQEFGMRIPYQYSASKIWADGNVIAQNGIVGKSPTETRQECWNKTVYFTVSDKGSFDIVMQLSNFGFHKGGTGSSLKIGTPAKIQAVHYYGLMMDLIL
ncbi:MAG: hypothetical protein ACRCUT_04815, partial [Spirochaetota bacterium]